MQDLTRQRSRISKFLHGRASEELISQGIDAALIGKVLEYGRSADVITGVVADGDTDLSTVPVQIQIMSGGDISPSCSSCGGEENWCHHSVALLWRATELGFLDPDHVAATEMSRAKARTPEEFGNTLREVSALIKRGAVDGAFAPEVTLFLDLSGDRVGVQVLFDDEIQIPSPARRPSIRALDNMLLHLLDEHAVWDEFSQLWFVSDSSYVETLLGLAQEYDNVRLFGKTETVSFASGVLSTRISLKWVEKGAEIHQLWVLPSGEAIQREGEIIGTGPFWVFLQGTVYRVGSVASRIAALFSHSGVLAIPSSSVGPVLEALQQLDDTSGLIEVVNPAKTPKCEIATPKVTVEFERRDLLEANLPVPEVYISTKYDYPEPPNKNTVYLPNREYERFVSETLAGIGFESVEGSRQGFIITGDPLLDLLSNGEKSLPKEWEIVGFDAAAKGVRFANLGLHISVGSGLDKQNDTGKIDWFECQVSLQQNNANVPLSSLFRNVISPDSKWVKLDSGAYAKIPGGGMTNLRTTLGLLDPNYRLSNTIRGKISAAQAMSFSSIQDKDITLALDSKVKTLNKKFAEFSSLALVEPPAAFVGKLRSYQQEGLSWLNFLYDFEFGGVLADEMGLGKTVQTLAFIQRLKAGRKGSKHQKLPVLVVAPTSVMMNWYYEAKQFTPELKSVVLHGPGRKSYFSKLSEYDIVITSYALLRLDRIELERQQFLYVILDEAQNIKNPDAAVTKSAKSLRSLRRLALTGTPTENRPMELWSIVDFLMPGYLGSYEFFKNFIEKPILEGGPGVEVTKVLQAKIKPFLLRRTKAQVEKELPPKIESVIHVEMAPSQKRLYNQILEEVRPRVFESVDQKGIRGASVSILAALLRLRQVCNHPNSIDALKHAPGYESGKFNALKEVLEEALDSGRKILLFAQFREMLAIIRRWLDEVGIEHEYLDGETRNRQDVVNRFNNDPSKRIFVISLKAGGTGLNLASADMVVIYDPWWNPAVESQAVDRAHRIGQTKTVNVYRLVTEDSIEQKIMDLKARKARIVDALVNENALSPRALSRTDLEMLFAPMAID